VKKSKLIDLFGLSGDSSSDDQLDDLLFRLESERPTTLHGNSKDAFMSAFVTTGNTSRESRDGLFNCSNQINAVSGLRRDSRNSGGVHSILMNPLRKARDKSEFKN
jgi:hypothetical protein